MRPTLLKNSLWMLGGQGLSLFTQAAYFVIIARLLGTTQYGVIVGATALVSILSQYGALGSGLLFLRYVSPDHTSFARYWGNILISSFTLGGALVLLLHFTARVFLPSIDSRIILLFAISDCVFGQISVACSQVFQAFEKMHITASLGSAVSLTRMILAFVLLLSVHHANAMVWAIASLAISFLTAIVSVSLVTANFGRPQLQPFLFTKHASEGFIFAVSGSTTSIYNDIDKAMLAHYGMNTVNGIYTMAYRVVDIATIPIRSVHSAAFPNFFRHGATAEGLRATKRFAAKLLGRTSLLGIVAAVGLYVAAPIIPHIIGHSFAPSVQVLRWLCFIPLFRSFHLSAGDALAGAGKQSWRLAFQMLAALGNFCANLYLIPHFGWKGAASSSIATDGVLGIFLWGVLAYQTRAVKAVGLSLRSKLESQFN
jgi:O-antigen/teichoic acid export membrane protein